MSVHHLICKDQEIFNGQGFAAEAEEAESDGEWGLALPLLLVVKLQVFLKSG